MNDENAAGHSPAAPPANEGRNEAVLAAACRVRLCVRLAAVAAVLVSFFLGGMFWALGAVLGALLVEVNVFFLMRVLKKAAQWRGTSLGPTLTVFYLSFGATALVCFLIIRNQWGHPLGFLAGLLSFFGGLVLALITLSLRPAKAD